VSLNKTLRCSSLQLAAYVIYSHKISSKIATGLYFCCSRKLGLPAK